jgi:SAM-dependent methyltransferase
MSAPKHEVVQAEHWNPHASMPLIIPTLVMCNTSDESLSANIRTNSEQNYPWLQAKAETPRPIVLIGGGPSAADHIDDIKALQSEGAVVYAMNGASAWARSMGIHVDVQVVADAKEETATLVDKGAAAHYFASQCSPVTFAAAPNPTLWHLEIGTIESLLDQERVRKGGYVLIGGGAAVGNSALCVAYSQGFRNMHVFGYDSSHRGRDSHAYPQPMNDFIPCMEVKWGGHTFRASVAMKAQAEKFQLTAQALKQEGCKLYLYGDGLLQAMYNTKPKDLSEQQKYQLMWQYDVYRECSPGERVVNDFIRLVQPDDMVIDFGCGTGRASLKLLQKNIPVLAIDFTDNCRDDEALVVPFLQWDLTRPIPARANFGFCSDVMEHIPPDDVRLVIKNIMDAAKTVFFQISTTEDHYGQLIENHLHLTVREGAWWKAVAEELGYSVSWSHEHECAVFLIVHREPLQ